MQQWIKYEIGNGVNTFLWIDNWHPLGPLILKYGDRVLFNLGRSLKAKVASVIGPNGWRWNKVRHPVVRDIIAHTAGSFLPNIQQDDSVSWVLNVNKIYSVQSAWSNLRASGPKVEWYQVVWFKHHVPRWSVIQWMIILGQLPTRDRLCSGGLLLIPIALCCKSHLHLFFGCSLFFYLVVFSGEE